jgi:hypothetical protein
MSRKPSYDNSWIDESMDEFVEVLEIIGEAPLELMAPPEIWQQLTGDAHKSAGHHIGKTATRPEGPIVLSRIDGDNHRFYRLRNSPAKGLAVNID